MATNMRFNPRNKALSEANTKLILASLKTSPRSITELVMVTGLTRPTVIKKLDQNKELIELTDTYPKRYFLKGVEYKTVIDEVVDKESGRKPAKRIDAVKAAIVNSESVVFFPQATYNDYTNLHDFILSKEDPSLVQQAYQNIKSAKDIEIFEHTMKTMYDLIQWRKKLKGEFNE